MNQIDRFVYDGTLPDSFFRISEKIYQGSTIRPAEDPELIRTLFEMEALQHDIVIYTDHENFRLAGIFPKQEKGAYFGFWESTNSAELNVQVFRLLEADARERNRENLIGPINFSTYHQNRLRIGLHPSWSMFDKEPVNPTYYPDLLALVNFREKITYESRIVKKEDLPGLYVDKDNFIKAINKIPFDFIPLTPENWKRYEKEIFGLIDAIFSENPFYKPISFDQFKLIYNYKFSAKLCPHSSVILQDRASGRLVAISMCHPNYHSLYPTVKEPTFARDYSKLLHKTILAKTIGVHPDFRRLGLMNYIGAYGLLSLRELYDDVMFCLMRSDNFSVHFSNHVPYELARYALYEKNLVN
ncbi:hypothetical protein H7F33_19695 [Pedobacter sp. PAMC26386]|nr:hypothetical protein H7F33_19695 [Pedobacter sp. PAMC26386]